MAVIKQHSPEAAPAPLQELHPTPQPSSPLGSLLQHGLLLGSAEWKLQAGEGCSRLNIRAVVSTQTHTSISSGCECRVWLPTQRCMTLNEASQVADTAERFYFFLQVSKDLRRIFLFYTQVTDPQTCCCDRAVKQEL